MDTEVTSNVTSEEGAGANEQNLADSAASGANEQNLAESAAGQQGAAEGQQGVQTAEERHRQAEERRKAEREKLSREVREQVNAENEGRMNALVASMNRVNPFTKKPITTMKELEEYNEENSRRAREARLSKLGISQEDFDALLSEHPAVKAAEKAAEELKAQKIMLERAQQQEELRAEMAEIQKIDPNIKTGNDLMNHPLYSEVKKLVRENGHSISEAFRIATEPSRAKEQNDRVRQSAAQAAAGKNHLSSIAAAGGTAPQVTVPDAVMKNYRRINPKITPEEARAKYAHFLGLKRI